MSKVPEVLVIIRSDAETGEPVAFMPLEPGTSDPYTMCCYAHIGQHSSASIDYYNSTRPANIHSDEAANELWRELRGIYECEPDFTELRLGYRMPTNAIAIRRGKLAC